MTATYERLEGTRAGRTCNGACLELFRNVNFGVSCDDAATVFRRTERQALSWPSIVEGSSRGPNASRWGISGMGQMFLVDSKGTIQARDLELPELDVKIRELLK